VWPRLCGRVRLSSDVSEIKLVFRISPERPSPNFAASWNVAPTNPLPEPRYFSMPSTVVGAEVRMKRDLNCWPWVRSLTHSPDAVTYSPAAITAAWPMTVIRVAVAARLDAENAEAVLGVVESDTLDDAGQNLPGR
jgi:hypothetical protein